jgi:hypothetical protein
MKKVFLIIVIAAIGFGIYWTKFRTKESHSEEPKQAAITLKKHSEKFNNSIDSLVNAYLDMKNSFVEADTASAKKSTRKFIEIIDKVPLDELKTDTATVVQTVKGNIMDIRSNAVSLLQQTDITEMRKDFSMVTEMMYPSFFTAVNYEGPKLFVANCPMAFGDNVAANWISSSAEIINPYLGKNHPKYKSGMLDCGEVKDSIIAK